MADSEIVCVPDAVDVTSEKPNLEGMMGRWAFVIGHGVFLFWDGIERTSEHLHERDTLFNHSWPFYHDHASDFGRLSTFTTLFCRIITFTKVSIGPAVGRLDDSMEFEGIA